MTKEKLIVFVPFILIIISGCIGMEGNVILDKGIASDVKDTSSEPTKEVISDLTKKSNDIVKDSEGKKEDNRQESPEESDEAPNHKEEINEQIPPELICTESWTCTSWIPQACDETRIQTRICTDLSKCGTEKSKPIESQTCNYAPACTESWTCTSWTPEICDYKQIQTRTCTDKNNCGTNANKPPESQACICEPFYDNCGIWEPEICNSSKIQTQKCYDSVCNAENYIENTRECTCEPSWVCLSWSECSPEGIKTRNCIDIRCENSNRNEQQTCTYTPPQAPDTIKIASWNIKDFGKTKATDPVRMAKIASVLNGYDIIAVQEISNVREQSDPGCPRNEGLCPGDPNCNLIQNALETYLNNAYNENYRFVFSPQVKDERYLFIYDPDTVEFIGAELANDPEDTLPICDTSSSGLMVRQPFKATFKAGNFDFVLMTVHTSPSINIQELEGLAYFYEQALQEGEPDVIILGDLNADCTYLKAADNIALRDSSYTWIVRDDEDTTVSSTDCAYDRFIFTEATVEDYTGNYGMYKDITSDISDHYLIWAEFWTGKDSD